MDIDLGQGKMDGTEATETILEEHDLPIVFLTSYSEEKMINKVRGITRCGYVLKNAGEFVLHEYISMNLIKRLNENGVVEDLESEFRCKDGSTRIE